MSPAIPPCISRRPARSALVAFVALSLSSVGSGGVQAAPPTVPSTSSNSKVNALPSPTEATLEEGKMLYENRQYVAALGKFMTVLRQDEHHPEARRYLKRIVDEMKENPAAVANRTVPGGQAAAPSAVQGELREMMRKRSIFSMDLAAIPGVSLDFKNGVGQLAVQTDLLFSPESGGLKEQGVPILDRVAAWLKTYGQQPIIIHLYPEELADPTTNDNLYLRRYSELYNFFVQERKISPQRLVSADLLTDDDNAKTPAAAVDVSSSTPRVVIESVGSQASLVKDMPSEAPRHALARWLEFAIMTSRPMFNPEEGEWASLDIAALARNGVRTWDFKIVPDGSKTPVMALSGKGNVLKRVSWDGRNDKTGSVVAPGAYTAKLSATDADGILMTRDITLHVQRAEGVAPLVALRSKKAPAKKPAVKKAKAAPAPAAPAASKTPAVEATKPAPEPAAIPKATPPSAPPADTSDDSESLLDAKPAKPMAATPPPPPAAAPTPEPESAPAAAAEPEEAASSDQAIWKQVIQFDRGSSDVKPTLKASLERIGKTLEVYPLQKVRIIGFAATSEPNAAALAKQRAETVRAILVEQYKVDKRRVLVAGGKTSGASNASKVELSITN